MGMSLTNEIEWCKAVIDLRFSQYFSADDSEEKKLGSFAIFVNENAPESLSFVGRLRDLKSKFAEFPYSSCM